MGNLVFQCSSVPAPRRYWKTDIANFCNISKGVRKSNGVDIPLM